MHSCLNYWNVTAVSAHLIVHLVIFICCDLDLFDLIKVTCMVGTQSCPQSECQNKCGSKCDSSNKMATHECTTSSYSKMTNFQNQTAV